MKRSPGGAADTAALSEHLDKLTDLMVHPACLPAAAAATAALRLAARGKAVDLFKRSAGGAADTAALSEHLDKLNQLEARAGGAEGAAGGAGGEGEGDEAVEVVHDEDDDDVMEEDDYYQVGGLVIH